MTGLLAQLKPMFVLQGLSCGLMFALMVVILGCLVLIAAAVGGAGLELGNVFSGRGKKREQRKERQDRQNQQQQHRQRMQQMQQRRADARRRQQLAQQRLRMQRRHQ